MYKHVNFKLVGVFKGVLVLQSGSKLYAVAANSRFVFRDRFRYSGRWYRVINCHSVGSETIEFISNFNAVLRGFIFDHMFAEYLNDDIFTICELV